MSIGFKFPFIKSSGSLGYFELTTDELSAVKQNLRVILSTNWGERVNHYYFGCNLREFLFDNIQSDDKIKDRIISQINTWLPFVILKKIEVFFGKNNDFSDIIKIKLEFALNSRPDLTSQIEKIIQ